MKTFTSAIAALYLALLSSGQAAPVELRCTEVDPPRTDPNTPTLSISLDDSEKAANFAVSELWVHKAQPTAVWDDKYIAWSQVLPTSALFKDFMGIDTFVYERATGKLLWASIDPLDADQNAREGRRQVSRTLKQEIPRLYVCGGQKP